MEAVEQRVENAKTLWQKAELAEQNGQIQLAYQYYTEGHDLIMDCAYLHQQAHQHLRRVNFKLGNYGEWLTDCLLHLFAPLGVFELVSYFAKSDAFGASICKRR